MNKFEIYQLTLKRVELVMSGEVFLMFTMPVTEPEMKQAVLDYKLKVIADYTKACVDYFGSTNGCGIEYFTKMAYTGELIERTTVIDG